MEEFYAYVLIRTEPGFARRVAELVQDLPEVDEARDVAGPYDVIAKVRCSDLNLLGKLVVRKIQALDGIVQTLTLPEMSTA